MIKLIKYWLWLRKKKKRIKYPKGYTPTIYEQTEGFSDDEIKTCSEIQKMIKKNTDKYYTIIECYDLYQITGSIHYENVKEYLR